MKAIVIDTNVVVSAALSPKGNPAKIIQLVSDNDEVQIYYSEDILAEYREVLSREHLKIDPKTQSNIVSAMQENGVFIKPIISGIKLPDESDRGFYDAAKTANAYLITGNTKHYPDEEFILTPSEFVKLIEDEER